MTCGHNTIIPDGTAGKAREQKGARRNDGQGKRCEQEKRDAKRNAGWYRSAHEGPERGEKSAGRGERDTRSAQKGTTPEATGTGALIKTPVGEEVCVNGGCERRRHRERNGGRGKAGERKQTPAGGERCARTETAGKGTGKEGRE